MTRPPGSKGASRRSPPPPRMPARASFLTLTCFIFFLRSSHAAAAAWWSMLSGILSLRNTDSLAYCFCTPLPKSSRTVKPERRSPPGKTDFGVPKNMVSLSRVKINRYNSAFGRIVTASAIPIASRWAGCFLPVRFRTVCAVNAQTWRNSNQNCNGIRPFQSLRDGPDVSCRYVFVRSAQ